MEINIIALFWHSWGKPYKTYPIIKSDYIWPFFPWSRLVWESIDQNSPKLGAGINTIKKKIIKIIQISAKVSPLACFSLTCILLICVYGFVFLILLTKEYTLIDPPQALKSWNWSCECEWIHLSHNILSLCRELLGSDLRGVWDIKVEFIFLNSTFFYY